MPYATPEKRRIGRRASYAVNREARQERARREWADRDPVKVAAQRRKQRYGMDADKFDALFQAQEGKCALCREPLKLHRPKSVHVDHDHETKKVRGILCARCNLGLGRFGDSVEQLQAAIAYLLKGRNGA